jgi:Chitinase class I
MWSLSVCQNFHTSEKKNLLQTIDLYWINVSVFYTETTIMVPAVKQSGGVFSTISTWLPVCHRPNGLFSNLHMVLDDPAITQAWPASGPHQLLISLLGGCWAVAEGENIFNIFTGVSCINFKRIVWKSSNFLYIQSKFVNSSDVICIHYDKCSSTTDAGYRVTTDIINGDLECGKGSDKTDAVANRIGFYKLYCDILGVSYSNNLDCYNKNNCHPTPFSRWLKRMSPWKRQYLWARIFVSFFS